jgi:hypothetical protein
MGILWTLAKMRDSVIKYGAVEYKKLESGMKFQIQEKKNGPLDNQQAGNIVDEGPGLTI